MSTKQKDMQSPIFVVGANRSGTTLLRLMLNAHSRIAIPEELTYFNTYLAGENIQHWRQPDLSRAQYAKHVEDFLKRNEEAFKPLRVCDLKAYVLSAPAMNLRLPYELAIERWTQYYGKQRWGEKTPGNLFFVDIILDMFPNARFVYLMRDPRAGVYSMMRTRIFSDDVAINALNRHKYAATGLALLENIVPAAQYVLIRYEDLVSFPEKTLQKVCACLGEPFEAGMLDFHRDVRRYMKKRAVNEFNPAATKPVSDEHIEAWRGALSAEDVAVIEAICREEMIRFGYSLEVQPLRLRRRVDVCIKRAYWKLQDWRHRHVPQYVVKHRMLDRSRQRLHRFLGRSVARKDTPRDVVQV